MQVREQDGVVIYNEIQFNGARAAIQGLPSDQVDAVLETYAKAAFAQELAGAAHNGANLEATVTAMKGELKSSMVPNIP